ncbi:hypothetical protein Rctr16k_03 [Virus Rctr16k]|nr:hypothetical protein Rctr16k_03 [Virus Rctr16k]
MTLRRGYLACLGDLRSDLIAAGVVTPGLLVTRFELPAGTRVLRLDDIGRAAARRHMQAGEFGRRQMPLSMSTLGEWMRERRKGNGSG